MSLRKREGEWKNQPWSLDLEIWGKSDNSEVLNWNMSVSFRDIKVPFELLMTVSKGAYGQVPAFVDDLKFKVKSHINNVMRGKLIAKC